MVSALSHLSAAPIPHPKPLPLSPHSAALERAASILPGGKDRAPIIRHRHRTALAVQCHVNDFRLAHESAALILRDLLHGEAGVADRFESGSHDEVITWKRRIAERNIDVANNSPL